MLMLYFRIVLPRGSGANHINRLRTPMAGSRLRRNRTTGMCRSEVGLCLGGGWGLAVALQRGQGVIR